MILFEIIVASRNLDLVQT